MYALMNNATGIITTARFNSIENAEQATSGYENLFTIIEIVEVPEEYIHA